MLSRLLHLSRFALAHAVRSTVPTSCALCGSDHAEAVCDCCNARYFSQAHQRCACCAIPLAAASVDALCGQCQQRPPAFDATVVATDYAPPVDQLVLALKFGNRLELAPLFGRMLRDAAHATDVALPMLLTAVPLGSMRLAERGFNQSLEIAKPLAPALGATLDARMLVRQRDTRAQALLHPDERHRNVRGAFIVSARSIDKVRGQHVGVVDDVMTTGETLNEVAMTLKRFGAARVTNLVFARTSQH